MSSGGGKASTPKLLDDNLKSKQFYRVLDLISEGPIAGPVDQEHLSSFKLNKTPITDSNGNVNVNGISVARRLDRKLRSQSTASLQSKRRPLLTLRSLTIPRWLEP